MRILLISGTTQDNELFFKRLSPLIETIKRNNDNRIGVIMPGQRTQIEMPGNTIIKYIVDSRGDSKLQIPRFTPKQINDLNNFLSEFDPDIIHSFDEGLLALLTQYFAIRKRIPFILSLGNIIDKEGTFTDKLLLKLLSPFGFNERFIGNFYHNATAIIYDNELQNEFINKIEYKGKVIKEDINDICEKYKEIIRSHEQYVGSKVYSNITKYIPSEFLKDTIDDILPKKRGVSIKSLFWFLAAIFGSMITYIGIRGRQSLNKSKNGKDSKDNKDNNN